MWLANERVRGWLDGSEIRMAYLFLFSILGGISPFLPVWYASLGLSKEQIGTLTGLAPAVILFASPTVTALADSTNARVGVMMVGVIVAVSARSAMFLLAKSYFVILPFVIVYASAAAALPALTDALAVDNSKGNYGSVRLLGSVGFGLAAMLSGSLIGDGTFWRIFLVNGMYGALLLLVLLSFRGKDKGQKDGAPSRWIGSMFGELGKALRRLDAALFLLVTFFSGAFTGIIDSFLFLRLQELGAPGICLGLARLINCASELPVFFYSRLIIEKIGLFNVVIFTQACYVIRFYTYSTVTIPWYILPIEAIHGITFSLFYTAGVYFVRSLAPKSAMTTMQGVLSATHWGVGYGCGALSGGFLYERLGVTRMFLMLSILSACSSATAFVLSKVTTTTTDEILLKIDQSSNATKPEPAAEDNSKLLDSEFVITEME